MSFEWQNVTVSKQMLSVVWYQSWNNNAYIFGNGFYDYKVIDSVMCRLEYSDILTHTLCSQLPMMLQTLTNVGVCIIVSKKLSLCPALTLTTEFLDIFQNVRFQLPKRLFGCVQNTLVHVDRALDVRRYVVGRCTLRAVWTVSKKWNQYSHSDFSQLQRVQDHLI